MKPGTLAWNVFVFAGCAYLVAARGWSPWWFVFACAVMAFDVEDK